MRSTIAAAALLALGLVSAAHAQDASRPAVEFVVEPGEASAVPFKQAVSWANGGVIDVALPNSTTLVVTMSGITATNADLCRTSVASYDFELTQAFTVVVNSQRIKSVKLVMESRVNGLLRSNHEPYTHTHWLLNKHCGTAEMQPAVATVSGDVGEVVALALPARSTSDCMDLSVYNHEGPLSVPVAAGRYVLHEKWGFGTMHPAFICRGASAEFAPQPAYSQGPHSYWFEHFQPFNGAASKDFGYQVTIKLVPEFKTPEKLPEKPMPETKPPEKPMPEPKPKEKPLPEPKP